MIISFSFFLLIFVAIGLLSALVNKHNNADYLLANYSVKPWLVALSAVASCNSGFMFIGMIGYTYIYGLSSIWLMIGWVLGDFLASLFIHKKLRIITKEKLILSFAGVISKWGDFNYKKLRAYLGVVTVIFLGTYAAAQLSAGSKALHVLFGWNYEVGAIIGAIMVLLYCFVGGIRASIWTDAAQSFVMMLAMGLLCFVAIKEIGGGLEFVARANLVSDNYLSLFPQNIEFGYFIGPVLFVVGWLFAGFGVIGQPHIMVRFMAMDDPKNMKKVRCYYYSFYAIFYFLTILAGMVSRILIPDSNNFDAELALPTLASSLLPEILVGLILAGLFAATMSTADSQILSCTAALTRDFNSGKPSYLITKLATILVTLISLLIALYGSKSVFSLVLISWSALACAFSPLLIIYVFKGRPSENLSLLISISSILMMLIWHYSELNKYIYEIAPGMIFGVLVYFALKKFSRYTSLQKTHQKHSK